MLNACNNTPQHLRCEMINGSGFGESSSSFPVDSFLMIDGKSAYIWFNGHKNKVVANNQLLFYK